MNDEEIEKLIKRLLALISSDYGCECELKSNSVKQFYICTYVNELFWRSYFVGNIIYESFDSLNSMLQTLLSPSYELWIFGNNGIKHEIPVAKKYGLTIEQLKITLDLKQIYD